jgi:protein gp37
VNKTAIEWCDYTWNPVTGCKHDCPYCYARKIAERFKGGKAWPNGFAPTLHPERMNDPMRQKTPQTIFVCSMADLFGTWVPDGWIHTVFMAMLRAPQHRYIMLTKDPNRAGHRFMDNFYSFGEKLLPSKIPRNWWIGASVESSRYTGRIDDLRRIPTGNLFVSFEPLLGPVDSEDFPLDLKGIAQVIVGAQTNPTVIPPSNAISDIVKTAKNQNALVFFKDSMNGVPWPGQSTFVNVHDLAWPLRKEVSA